MSNGEEMTEREKEVLAEREARTPGTPLVDGGLKGIQVPTDEDAAQLKEELDGMTEEEKQEVLKAVLAWGKLFAELAG